MKRQAILAFTALLAATIVSAEPPARTYTRPAIPTDEALKKLNLKVGWRTFLPVDGSRDGVATMQLLDTQLLIQMRSGVIVSLDPENGQTQWLARIGPTYRASQPLGHNIDTIFGYNLTTLFALERANGHVRWLAQVPTVPTCPPAADSERVYCCLTGQHMYAYRLPKTHELLALGDREAEMRGIPTGTSSQTRGLLTTTNSTRSSGLRDSGELPLAWEYNAVTRLENTPIVTPRAKEKEGGFIVIANGDGRLTVSSKYEKDIRSRSTVNRPLAVPLVEHNGVVYAASDDNYLLAMNIENGLTAWRFGAGGPIFVRPDVTDEDVYISTRRSGVYRIDRESGALRWRNQAAERFLAANKKWVYALDTTGKLLVIERDRGSTLFTVDMRDFALSTGNDLTDRIYLASNDGLVLCLHDRGYTKPLVNKTVVEEKPVPPPPRTDVLEKKDAPPPEKKDAPPEKKDAPEKKEMEKKDAPEKKEMEKKEMEKKEMEKKDAEKKDAEKKDAEKKDK
jgi:outer membrane protein assembly factor BamB